MLKNGNVQQDIYKVGGKEIKNDYWSNCADASHKGIEDGGNGRERA